ncbi:MAG: methyltransferase domain-containing protein [Gammaproteobacteria bacterium]|nr:methyltransferase domain-containing protein [Gammaproteobacteria bacterium]
MSLRTSYSLIAPFYDLAIDRFSRELRRRSLQRLGTVEGQSILVTGIGTGLDIPYLPQGASYTGIDLTPAMLKRAQRLVGPEQDISLETGDAMQLPYEDEHFDAIVMHLILAVVPEPRRALSEAARVLKPGGRVLILDKFLRRGELALGRRLINPLISRLATRTDVVFEDVLKAAPGLRIRSDEAAAAGGWFRHIELDKA